ncbi:LemA family protein [Mesonia sp.]|uniref:LemA family protein n=1 Tax=Mesonia sp. TaxID=1960830 RepID=UPI00175C7FA1|nr:LemA family protein [Mesonia sp.]HIB37573.1 LemA family protein [Mesonia sp.]HIO27171.1 LemA family protein [Flavobacteriaceae bacterium]
MKKWLIPVIIIVVLGIIGYSLTAGVNNTAVELEEDVKASWANVESAYQRRTDLIPNLVNTVKGAADFEQETLTGVIEARAKATAVNINADNLDSASLQKFQEAQSGLSSALSKLMVSVERYPQLTATQNFSNLQSQLEGTENRINVERNRFNEKVRAYNTYIRKFPNNIFAGMFGFEKMTPFEAQAGAANAPTVEF